MTLVTRAMGTLNERLRDLKQAELWSKKRSFRTIRVTDASI